MTEKKELYGIDGLRLSIKGRSVLHATRLRIDSGGICCLVGPNGSGKSLALSMLAGLHEPDEATLFYRGRPMKELQKDGGLGSEITLLHQHPFLFSRSVLANVSYGMGRQGLSRQETERRAKGLLARVGLEGFGRRRARRLSAGETARVALARALGCGARTLLLDEPTAAIDRQGEKLVEEIIFEAAKDAEKTVIMSTHNMDQARRLARTILFVQEGTIGEWEPENILAGEIVRHNGENVFRSDRFSLAIEGKTAPGRCHVGIAEGDILLQPLGETGRSVNAISGRIVSLSGDNGDIRVTIDAGERISMKMKGGNDRAGSLGIGSSVRVTIPPEKVRVLRLNHGRGD